MKPSDLKPGRIRHAQLPPELVLRMGTVRAALIDVFPVTEAEWRDAFQRDVNPEHELLWWERVAGCYVAVSAAWTFSPDERQAAFNIIFGLFSGLQPEQLQVDLAKLPDGAVSELLAIVSKLVISGRES